MIQIIAALGIIAWSLTRPKAKEIVQQLVEKETISLVSCPSGLCEIQEGFPLKDDCQYCGFCFDKEDIFKKAQKKTYTICDSQNNELEAFNLTAPIIINSDGEIKLKEFELEPKTIESLNDFAVIMHFAKLLNNYKGLSLEEGGLNLMFVDYWKLLGMSQDEAETLVYEQGQIPSNSTPLIHDFWTKL